MPAPQRPSPEAAGPDGEARLFNRNFLLACLTTLATFTSFYLLLATLPLYIVRLGGGEAEVGLIIGVFSATALVLRPFVGAGSDERGKRVFVLAGNAILAVSSGLYWLVATVPLLLGLRVLHGVGWSSFGTAVGALVADAAPPSRRGEAMGYYGMFNNLAMAVGPALGVTIMEGYGFPTLFAVAAAIGVASTLLALPIRERARPAAAPPAMPLAARLIERGALFPSLILALVAMTYGSIVSFLPVYAARQAIGNPGLFFTVYAGVLLVARGFTGQLSDRYGRAAVILPGLALATAALWLLATATSPAMFAAVAALYGLGFAAIQPSMMAMVVDRAAPNRRGAAMGTFSSAMDLGIGGGSILWGVVAQLAGYEAMYAASGGVAALAFVVFAASARRGRPAGVEGQR
jgi:MFS family permease